MRYLLTYFLQYPCNLLPDGPGCFSSHRIIVIGEFISTIFYLLSFENKQTSGSSQDSNQRISSFRNKQHTYFFKITGNICKYFQVGHCKHGDACQSEHIAEKCPNKKCHDPRCVLHPKTCRHFKKFQYLQILHLLQL